MTHLAEEIPPSLHPRELQPLAQAILRARGVELFDDPRSEVEVAIAMGYLSLQNDSGQAITLAQSEV